MSEFNRPANFKFNLGDEVEDTISGFKGIVGNRTQWLNGCNTYGVKPTKLKEGKMMSTEHFDEPQLKLKTADVVEGQHATGGPAAAPVRPD